jgi:hypothetical protein
MHVLLFGFVITSLSWFTYQQFKPSRMTLQQRIASINTNFGTEFISGDPFLGRNGRGFLFDDKNRKVCYFMDTEGELLDFDYFRSWGIAPTGDFGFIFLTTDRNRPVIKISVTSLAEMAIWRRRLADSLPPIVPSALAA